MPEPDYETVVDYPKRLSFSTISSTSKALKSGPESLQLVLFGQGEAGNLSQASQYLIIIFFSSLKNKVKVSFTNLNIFWSKFIFLFYFP